MMNRIRQFMYGRYGGNDALNMVLILSGAVITLILSLFFYKVPFVRFLGTVPYIIAIIRALSKNIQARREENMKFLTVSEPVRRKLINKVSRLKDKEHKYFSCPGCKRTLRVPKGRGRIKINCPHCGRDFFRKT